METLENEDIATQLVLKTPKKDNKALLPKRYPKTDLFICDVADAVLKDINQHMEHPFYSLSKKPETSIRRYENNGNWLEVTPSVKGLATIYDKDILIYAVSQLIAKRNTGENISPYVRINSYEFLVFSNRGTGGKDYKALVESIERLRGTMITTNIVTGDEEQTETFGLIDKGTIKRKLGLDGRLEWVEVKLSDWVFNAIAAQEVLTLHPNYFRLRKPLERRVYELARKHCGQQKTWKCSVKLLRKKSGAKSEMKRFRQMLKGIAENDHLPDYMLEFLEDDDQLLFINRDTMPKDKPKGKPDADDITHRLTPDVYEKAREIIPSIDIYYIAGIFSNWWTKLGKQSTANPDALFLKFCRTWIRNNPRAKEQSWITRA